MDSSKTGVDAVSNTPIGQIKNILIRNIHATIAGSDTARAGIIILGVNGMNIEDVSLSDIHLVFPGTGTILDAKRTLPNLEKVYPEPSWFGTLSVYGMYASHVNGLKLNNVSFA